MHTIHPPPKGICLINGEDRHILRSTAVNQDRGFVAF